MPRRVHNGRRNLQRTPKRTLLRAVDFTKGWIYFAYAPESKDVKSFNVRGHDDFRSLRESSWASQKLG